MRPNQKEMIANLIKEGRLAKGLTQKELSGLTNVSVRSIQRIENAELVPRSYTLKTLALTLDLPFETLQNEMAPTGISEPLISSKKNSTQKVILSVGICAILVLLAAAFLAQSPRFPETHFELLNFFAAVAAVLTIILFFIWRNKS